MLDPALEFSAGRRAMHWPNGEGPTVKVRETDPIWWALRGSAFS